MKVTAIMAAMLVAAPSASAYIAHHNAAADPCTAFDKKDCTKDSSCVYQVGERNTNLSRKASGGARHSAPEGEKAICAMEHLMDRAKASPRAKARLMENHGLNSDWDKMECAEAFYMKDCKDLNQHAEAEGQSTKCAWTCEGGCSAYDGEHRVYDQCMPDIPDTSGFTDMYLAHGYTGYPSGDNYCVSLDENGGAQNEWNPDNHDIYSEAYINGCFDACAADPKCVYDIANSPGGADDILAVIYPGSAQDGTCYCYMVDTTPNTPPEQLNCAGYYNMFIKNAHSQYDDLITNRMDTCGVNGVVHEDYRGLNFA